MSNYIGLVLCTDGTVARAPRFSSIKKDDQIVIDAPTGEEICTVEDYITLDSESDEYRFIKEIYASEICRASAILRKSELRYPEGDDGSDD